MEDMLASIWGTIKFFGVVGIIIITAIFLCDPATYSAKIGQNSVVKAINGHYKADSIRADSIRNAPR